MCVCFKKSYSSLRTNLNATSLWYLPYSTTWFLSWDLEAANKCDNRLYLCWYNSKDFLLRPTNNIFYEKPLFSWNKVIVIKVALFFIFLRISLISGLIEDSWVLISATNLFCYHAFFNLWKTPEFHSQWKNKNAKGKCFFVLYVLWK